MRGLVLPLTAVLLVSAGTLAAADKQYPVFTPDNFVNNMKLVGRNFAAVNAALAKSDYDTAKAQLTRSRELLAITITFWRDRKKDDAIKILRDGLSEMDELDASLSAEKIDPAAATALAKQAGAACQACHAAYREQDPATKAFRVKAGLLP